MLQPHRDSGPGCSRLAAEWGGGQNLRGQPEQHLEMLLGSQHFEG